MEKSTLVLGASVKPERYSFLAIVKLREKKITTFALGNKKGKVLDVVIDTEMQVFTSLHTVTIYVGPAIQEGYYDYLLSLKPSRVIFNPGTVNPTLIALLKKHLIEVEIACTLVLLSTNQY